MSMWCHISVMESKGENLKGNSCYHGYCMWILFDLLSWLFFILIIVVWSHLLSCIYNGIKKKTSFIMMIIKNISSKIYWGKHLICFQIYRKYISFHTLSFRIHVQRPALTKIAEYNKISWLYLLFFSILWICQYSEYSSTRYLDSFCILLSFLWICSIR